MSKCNVSWCVCLPMTGNVVCKQHRDVPLLHSWETAKDYLTRLKRVQAAARTAARKAAESDAKLAKRGTSASPR